MLSSGFSFAYKASIPSYAVGPELPLSEFWDPFPNIGVGRNLRLYIVLIGAAIRTGLFGANWRSTIGGRLGLRPEI